MRKTIFLIPAVALLTTVNTYAQTHRRDTAKTVQTATQPQTAPRATAVLTVRGSCNMCKTRIEKTAKALSGVTSASWDLKTQKLQTAFDDKKTSLDAISKALAKAGHDTEKHRTDDKTYNALPSCCKYRKE